MVNNGSSRHDDTGRFRRNSEITVEEIKKQWSIFTLITGILSCGVMGGSFAVLRYNGLAKASDVAALSAKMDATNSRLSTVENGLSSVKADVKDTHETVHEIFGAVVNGGKRR